MGQRLAMNSALAAHHPTEEPRRYGPATMLNAFSSLCCMQMITAGGQDEGHKAIIVMIKPKDQTKICDRRSAMPSSRNSLLTRHFAEAEVQAAIRPKPKSGRDLMTCAGDTSGQSLLIEMMTKTAPRMALIAPAAKDVRIGNGGENSGWFCFCSITGGLRNYEFVVA